MSSRYELCPPDNWVTNWGKPTKKLVAAAQSIITELDGVVTTQFPRVNTVQHGGSSTSVPTTISTQSQAPSHFAIDQAVVDSIKRLFSQPGPSQPFRSISDHPHCSKTFCQFSSDAPTPHGETSVRHKVDMIRFSPASASSKDSYTKTSFFNPQEELLLQSISSSSKQGLGYVNSSLIPDY